MALDHIAQLAGVVEIAGSAFYADGLGDRDLDIVDILLVPNGLKDGVGEAKYEDVLYRFLAQIVVDPVDLAFVEDRLKLGIEGPRRIEVRPERLFHNNTDKWLAVAVCGVVFGESAVLQHVDQT